MLTFMCVSPEDGHLRCVHFGALVNSVATTDLVRAFGRTCAHFCGLTFLSIC